MYSGEGEFVKWTKTFTCEGAVEVWQTLKSKPQPLNPKHQTLNPALNPKPNTQTLQAAPPTLITEMLHAVWLDALTTPQL